MAQRPPSKEQDIAEVPIDLRRAYGDRSNVVPGAIITGGSIVIIVALLIGLRWQQLLDFDQSAADQIHAWTSSHDWLVRPLEIIGVVFGNWTCVGVLAVLAGWAFWRREPWVGIWIITSAITVLLGNLLLKQLFARDRPQWDEPLHEIGQYSFPSGHAAGAGMFFTIAVLVTIIATGRGAKRRLLIGLWVLLGLMVAISRIMLGVHFISDIVAGLAFGITTTLLAWRLLLTGREHQPSEQTTKTGTGAKRASVILNPSKIADIEDFKTKVRFVAAMHGWGEPVWYETTVEDPGHGQTRDALSAGTDLIIAAGGDGTVRAVCEVSARSGVAVGILPHGTGNLLARNLAIPVNTRDALDIVFAGQDRAIDLASISADDSGSTSFLVMAGLGMDAEIMSGVNDELKSKVGYLAYFWSGLRAAFTFPATKVTITIDDEEPAKFRARTVVIGNVGFLQGGIPLLPEAQIDDGLLDVVVIAPKRVLGWLAIVTRVVTRRQHSNDRMARLQGRRIVVEAEKSVPMQLDGDSAGTAARLEATIDPGVLLVRVPAAPTPP